MSSTQHTRDGKILSMFAWLSVDETGHERLMVWWDEDQRAAIPLLAFAPDMERVMDGWAKLIVSETGRPCSKVLLIRGDVAGTHYPEGWHDEVGDQAARGQGGEG